MSGVRPIATRAYWIVTLAFLAVAIMAAARTPTDPAMGPIQKLFYLHLPIAINTFLSGAVVFVACVGYLGARRQVWDDLAQAAARVTVLNGTVLLLTGMFWARIAWGVWWTWSPRLAFSLLLWLLFVSYLALRPMIASPSRRAVVCAAYGVIGFLNVPLVYLSIEMLPDIHRTPMDLTAPMRWTLGLWFVPVTLLTAGLIAARFALAHHASLAHEGPRPAGAHA